MSVRRRPPRMTTVGRDGRAEAAVAFPVAGADERPATTLLRVAGLTLVGVQVLLTGQVLLGAVLTASSAAGAVVRLRRGAPASLLLAESGIVSRSPVGALDVPWTR